MNKKNKIIIKKKFLFVLFLFILVIAASAATYVIYTNDELAIEKQTINDFVKDTIGIDIDKTFFYSEENEEVLGDIQNEKSEKLLNDDNEKNFIIENLELPLCPKDALIITQENTQGVLETQEKEDSHQIIVHNGFTLCYREKYEQAEWVCYTLDAQKVQKNVERKDNFRPDSLVLTGSAELSDYKKSGYDRGHLCPSADLTYSQETMDESFVLSNMSPQVAKLNRGMWKDLEHELRTLTSHFDILYIVTGPILEKSDYSSIGKNQVAVPEYYYKAILAIKNDKYYMIGFVLPNSECKGTIWDYATNVEEIEKRTNLDFFSLLPDEQEHNLETTLEISDWKFN